MPAVILERGLGPGESSVLAMACFHPEMMAITDDLAGRKALLCERQPCYCDAAIVRWEALSGAKARRCCGTKTA